MRSFCALFWLYLWKTIFCHFAAQVTWPWAKNWNSKSTKNLSHNRFFRILNRPTLLKVVTFDRRPVTPYMTVSIFWLVFPYVIGWPETAKIVVFFSNIWRPALSDSHMNLAPNDRSQKYTVEQKPGWTRNAKWTLL